MKNEIRIDVPEGYEIDTENSTFACIKFKPKTGKWRNGQHMITGYWIANDSLIKDAYCSNTNKNINVFATEKQAKSALAMAQISQIIANDERFGGPITDEEWKCECTPKYVIGRYEDHIRMPQWFGYYQLLAFHTKEQRDLFLEENEDLVKDYLMID